MPYIVFVSFPGQQRRIKKIIEIAMTDRNFAPINVSVPEVKREQPDLSVQVKNERLNGYPDDGGGTSEDQAWANHDQQCCLIDTGRRCSRLAGNASFNKRIQKTVSQKKLKLHMDSSVSLNCLNFLFSR